MPSISSESFHFLAELWENNNKNWFDANRKRYDEHIAKPLKALAGDLAAPVMGILPEFSGKAKVSRINNDIRFAPNKPPYKEHMWVSFGGMSETVCSDFFCGIGRSGWACGVGIGAPKREPMEEWRRNLAGNSRRWLKYVNALEEGEKHALVYYLSNPFAKPLIPDAPAEVQPLIQARDVWIVQNPRLEFQGDPVREFYVGLCRMLPLFLFMRLPGALLEERLGELGTSIKPPDEVTARIWKAASE